MDPRRSIRLRGVRVHNLRDVDLDLPRGQLIVMCGLSGSGKSSLAFDTLYAEGQRRYIESFSAYTRQFLEQLERPDADKIEGIPPAIAVGQARPSRSNRSTIGTATETNDYLRLLMAKIGRVICQGCGKQVRRESPQSAAEQLAGLPEGARYLVCFPVELDEATEAASVAAELREDGFRRIVCDDKTIELDQQTPATGSLRWWVVVDRLAAGKVADARLRESLETAFDKGNGRALAFVLGDDEVLVADEDSGQLSEAEVQTIDGKSWRPLAWSDRLRCETCGVDFPTPEPRLYSFNSPLGACPTCEGFGDTQDVDMDLVVPDRGKSLSKGAIAPWTTPAYSHELEELQALAGDYNVPLDIPFAELDKSALEIIQEGVPKREFGGLRGFFAWLERRKYKTPIRVFLNRWRRYQTCATCGGTRLRPEALAARLGDKNIADLCSATIHETAAFFRELPLSDKERAIGRVMLEQVQARLGYLEEVGLGYLSLDRTLRTLSGGEAQRVALTSALGSSLVNMLYVLDEPTIGLHPRDTEGLIAAILNLRNRGNTVVVVEHEEAVIRAADQVVEIGPGAGDRGGKVTFQGSPEAMEAAEGNLTGDYLARRRGVFGAARRREAKHGNIRLTGAEGNNLKNLTVEFPLGLLCVVTGVSGSGKSTLVQDTLYPALCRRMKKTGPKPLPYQDVLGVGQINDVILVDQSPIGRSARSNPVTYIKAFDEIRSLFADTVDAHTRNYPAGYFSFNVDGGRCQMCQGEGRIEIDMQFMANVYMKCGGCGGSRYRDEILEVTHRGRNIADVLDMTVREAFAFFRGATKVQSRLKRLIDVGLEYIRLGQPAVTLSGGEAQRLKLAAYLSGAKRGRTLFLLDEPTTGLHFSDVVRLMDCFDALLDVGHSLIVVEHNMQLIRAADHVIDLGPGAADEGGLVVVQGAPEIVAQHPTSATASFLAQALAAGLEAADST